MIDGLAEVPSVELEQVSRMIGETDLESLFGYFMTERTHLTLLMARIDDSQAGRLGNALDGLAEAFPEHFVGWYHWCADNVVQEALLTRPRIATVVAGWQSQD